eukprot:COSAG05_NODE_7972_length_750_cov_0.943164_1_plen_211_part_01
MRSCLLNSLVVATFSVADGQQWPREPHDFFNNCSGIGTYRSGQGCICPQGTTGFDCQLLSTKHADHLKRQGGRSSYLAYPQRKSWQESKTYCEGKGGDLAGLGSKEEQQVVLDVARRYCPSAVATFVGFTDSEVEGQWRWAESNGLQARKSGASWYTNWAAGSPQKGNNQKDYAQLDTITGLWSDVEANTLGSCITCEFKVSSGVPPKVLL